MTRPRILLADDHTLMVEGLRKLLENEGELVGTVGDGRALLHAAETLKPDIILVDISMPLLNGLDAARHIRKTLPNAKIIFLTMHADPTYASEAFRAGASGYLLKHSDPGELSQAIRVALKDQYYVTPLMTKELLLPFLDSSRAHPPIRVDLTTRQREVLQLVAEGHSAKDIATILKISVRTVEFHKSKLMNQLGIHNSAELIKYAVAHGLAVS